MGYSHIGLEACEIGIGSPNVKDLLDRLPVDLGRTGNDPISLGNLERWCCIPGDLSLEGGEATGNLGRAIPYPKGRFIYPVEIFCIKRIFDISP
ncbi:MAG: hypothetical protein WCF90_05350 [Methanomicrobiales archaeon]